MLANILRSIGHAYKWIFSSAAKIALEVPTQFGEASKMVNESKFGRWIDWTLKEPLTFARWCSLWLLMAIVFGELAIVIWLLYLLSQGLEWIANAWQSIPNDPIPIRPIISVVVVCHVGAILYWLKKRKLLLYSILEIGLSLVIAWKGISEIKLGELASWAAIISSIYFFVRGIDNAATALDADSLQAVPASGKEQAA